MSYEFEIEDTFQLARRGLVVAVKGDTEFRLDNRLNVIIKDSDGNELFEDTATQEFARKLRDDSTVESIAFLMSTAKKEQVPLDGSVVVVGEIIETSI